MEVIGHPRMLVALALVLALGVVHAGPAHAATFAVNSSQDGGDARWSDGVCDTGAATPPGSEPPCTLRAAIQQANALAGADNIGFSVDQVTLTHAGRGDELAATGDLDIRQDLTIAGGVTVTADENFNDRIFHVVPPLGTTAKPAATIKNLTIERGEEIDGGGIYVAQSAKLDLIGSTVKDNAAIDADPQGDILGGGIYNGGTLKITKSTISGNTAQASGGGESYGAGLFVNGPATITDSTISGNEAVSTNATMAVSSGGGIYNQGSGLTMTNVTVSGNGAYGKTSIGGGITNTQWLLELTNATVNGNSAAYGANLQLSASNSFSIKNTLVANPQGGGSNCSGYVGSSGNNLSSDGSCHFTAAGDIQNRDAKLGPLQSNGGPTQTHALLSGSPATDAGLNTGCPGADGRGATRPQDGDGDGSAVCDIGAFEVDVKAPDTNIVSGPSGTINAASANLEFTASEPGSTFRCSFDSGVFEPCSLPKGYSNLEDGYHVLRVRAVDVSGNEDPTPAVRGWTVDTVRPTIRDLLPVPGSTIRDRTPLIEATVADDGTDLKSGDISLYLDGQKKSGFSYDPSTGRLTHTSGRLPYGVHTARVTARDKAGNRSARNWSFEVIR